MQFDAATQAWCTQINLKINSETKNKELKIATLNLCLGLKNKRNEVEKSKYFAYKKWR